MKSRSMDGIFEFLGEEYEFTVICEQRGDEWYPDRIVALDRSDGEALDEINYDELEEVAMQHAWRLE